MIPRLGRRGGGWVVLQDACGLAVIALQVVPGPRGPWLAAAVLSLAGVALAVWAARALGPALSHFPEPRAGAARVTRGPYRVLHHPIYVGLMLVCVGGSIRAPLAWIPTAAMAIVLTLKARLESQWLSRSRDSRAG